LCRPWRALDGEGQAGTVAERKAVKARDLHQTPQSAPDFVEGDGFALDFGDVPPGNLRLHTGRDELGKHSA